MNIVSIMVPDIIVISRWLFPQPKQCFLKLILLWKKCI